MAGADGEALETVYAVYEAVLAAEEIEDSDTYLEQIPGYTPDDRFYYNGREVAQLYVGTYANKPVYQYTNPATSIAVHVGETGSEQYLYTKSATCYCGNGLVEETPDWIAVDSKRKLTDSNPGIVGNPPTWSLAAYESEDWSDSLYAGYPALQIGVTGAKPGHTSLEFQTYQNYYYAYYWKTCRRCGQLYSEISFKGKWIEDTQTPTPTTAYKVEWYNEQRKQIKPTETRYGIAGETAKVTEDDKVVDGHVFAAKSTSNVLEKEIAADGTTVLKLFFTTESLKVTKTAAKRVERDENGKATACYVDYTVTLKSNLARPQYFIQFQDVMEKGLTFVTDETGALANLSYTLRKANGQTYECEDFGSWLNGEDIEDPDSRLDKNNTVAYICFQLNAENGFFENGDALIVKYTAKADTPIAEVTQYHNHVYATTWNAN